MCPVESDLGITGALRGVVADKGPDFVPRVPDPLRPGLFLAPGNITQAATYKMKHTRCIIQDATYQMQHTRCNIPDANCGINHTTALEFVMYHISIHIQRVPDPLRRGLVAPVWSHTAKADHSCSHARAATASLSASRGGGLHDIGTRGARSASCTASAAAECAPCGLPVSRFGADVMRTEERGRRSASSAVVVVDDREDAVVRLAHGCASAMQFELSKPPELKQFQEVSDDKAVRLPPIVTKKPQVGATSAPGLRSPAATAAPGLRSPFAALLPVVAGRRRRRRRRRANADRSEDTRAGGDDDGRMDRSEWPSRRHICTVAWLRTPPSRCNQPAVLSCAQSAFRRVTCTSALGSL